jgi:hypothetical protein
VAAFAFLGREPHLAEIHAVLIPEHRADAAAVGGQRVFLGRVLPAGLQNHRLQLECLAELGRRHRVVGLELAVLLHDAGHLPAHAPGQGGRDGFRVLHVVDDGVAQQQVAGHGVGRVGGAQAGAADDFGVQGFVVGLAGAEGGVEGPGAGGVAGLQLVGQPGHGLLARGRGRAVGKAAGAGLGRRGSGAATLGRGGAFFQVVAHGLPAGPAGHQRHIQGRADLGLGAEGGRQQQGAAQQKRMHLHGASGQQPGLVDPKLYGRAGRAVPAARG